MERKNIWIRLESRQTAAGETERMAHDLPGRLTLLEEGWAVSYREPEGSGLGESLTTLTAVPGKVILDRAGETACRMVFREGRRHLCDYATPYGSLPLEIFARKVRARREGTGGEVELHYDLSLSGGEPGETRLRLTFREER